MVASSVDSDYLTRLTVKRLAELNKARARVETLEARAGLLTEYEHEKRKLELLNRLQSAYLDVGPVLGDLSHYVLELKSYLQAVYDADLLGDVTLQSVTAQHCVSYAVRVLDRLSDATKYSLQGASGVLELASSALLMFSQRANSAEYLLEASAVPVAVKLLSPLFAPAIVVNVANTVGNLAEDTNFRLAFRAAGGIGALVRLLRSDVEASVQASAAAALSLLGARDLVVQDSVRYLGGLDHLVELLGSSDVYTADVAKYALLSLRHHNIKNQAEIMTAIRSSPTLARDVRRLDAASELLRFEDTTPTKAASSSAARRLFDSYDSYDSPVRPKTADHNSYRRALYVPPSSLRSPSAAAAAAASPVRSLVFGALDAPVTSTVSPLPRKLPASASALLSAAYSPLSSPRSVFDEWRVSTVPAVEGDLLRKKHLARYTPEELATLLQEFGFDQLDLRGFRIHGISGYDLLNMDETDLSIKLLLTRPKQRKLRQLQKAAALFDRIATLPRQGRISEIELRLYLASSGLGSSDVSKVVDLFKTLVRNDRLDFVTFWDFVVAYSWISQALRIYNVPV